MSAAYRIRSRSLVRIEEGLAVFIQERIPSMERPGVPGPLAWLGVAAMLLSLILLFLPPEARQGVRPLPLVLMVLWGVAGVLRIGWWWRRRRDYLEAVEAGTWGWFAVRFEAACGRVRLVGPAPRAAAGGTTGPEVDALPLARVEWREWNSPDHPWSDCVEPEDYVALNLAFRIRGEGLTPDWEGSFDLLDGTEPDHRWYVTAANPEAVRRRRLARGILALPSE